MSRWRHRQEAALVRAWAYVAVLDRDEGSVRADERGTDLRTGSAFPGSMGGGDAVWTNG